MRTRPASAGRRQDIHRSRRLESLSQPLLLRVPTPDCQGLSFCEPNARDLKTWLAGLPKANLGETARLLYQAMRELNQLRTPSQNRLQLLELMRPEIHFICRQLERNYLLNQPVVLGERPRKIASLCQALQNHLATGYKMITVRLAPQAERERLPLLTIVLQRAIHSLCAILARSTQLYSPPPEGLWLELHQLYTIAVEHGVQETLVRDDLARGSAGLSVERSYIVALMLGSARCNQLRQQSIAQLTQALEPWSALVRLLPAQHASSLLVLSPRQDGPPRYRSMVKGEELPLQLGIDPEILVQAIKAHLEDAPDTAGVKLEIPAGLGADLLQHLCSAWGSASERSFQRIQAQGSLQLCVGMSALHYHLAGQRPFGELLQRPESTHSSFKLNNAAPDVWSVAFDAQPVNEMGLLPTDCIEFVRPVKAEAEAASAPPAEPAYPIHDVQLVNHSPGGYCLSWSGETPAQLQAGELLGLRNNAEESWSVAVIRWVRQVRGSGPQMGVELIAPHAQPCGLRLLRKSDHGSEYLRALLLPEINVISRPATLIAPRLPFQEGHKVLINQNGEEHRALLRRRQNGSGSYNQFEYQLVSLAVAPQEKPPVTMRGAQGVSVGEDFDSLWKSL